MSIPTKQPREIFIDLPPNLGRGIQTAEPPNWTYWVRSKLVPRMFKAANGGAASRDGHGWPYDMSGTIYMGQLPHPRIILTIPDRRSGLTVGGDTLRGHSAQRIPPVLVRTSHR